MFIQWFPGHMTHAIRMMSQEIRLVDSVIYVLDARSPLSCINDVFDSIIGTRPCLYVLNKCDLVEYRDVLKWIDFFKRNGKACLPASNMGKHDTQNIISKLTEINTKTIEKYKARGISKTIRAMVIGVPNTGKSTIINCLTGGKKTATGNIPGVTRGKQWVVVNKYTELMDSPGVLYPDFKNQFKAIKLALIGSIKDDIIDTVELATEGIKLLTKIAPSMLESKYAINKTENSPISILEQICKHRGCILRGGELDLDRGGAAFINDFRKGLIGKIILDEIPIR